MSLVPSSVDKKVVRYDNISHTRERWTPESQLAKPSEDQLAAISLQTKRSLEEALNVKMGMHSTALSVSKRSDPEFVKYSTNPNAPGHNPQLSQRLVRIVEAQKDPLEPSKFRHRKVPPGPGDPPPPVMRSPPRKVSKEDQKTWQIPACVSNWKNARGYVIPLDKRIGADGRGLQDVTVNERFANFSEELYMAEQKARDDIRVRNELQKKQRAIEEEQREQELRRLAMEARKATTRPEESTHERARREIMRETLREHRMAKSGKTKGDRERDVSEQVALGRQVQPTLQGDSLYDARLFNQSTGLGSGFQEDDDNMAYDARLFADRSQSGIYKFDSKRMETARQEMDELERRQVSGPVQFAPADEDDLPIKRHRKD
jgi:SNW domain-containing protein 1